MPLLVPTEPITIGAPGTAPVFGAGAAPAPAGAPLARPGFGPAEDAGAALDAAAVFAVTPPAPLPGRAPAALPVAARSGEAPAPATADPPAPAGEAAPAPRLPPAAELVVAATGPAAAVGTAAASEPGAGTLFPAYPVTMARWSSLVPQADVTASIQAAARPTPARAVRPCIITSPRRS
jgi:hypothetical protein